MLTTYPIPKHILPPFPNATKNRSSSRFLCMLDASPSPEDTSQRSGRNSVGSGKTESFWRMERGFIPMGV
jgi:hypothetical protein